MKTTDLSALCLALVALAAGTSHAQPVPVGDAFQVNTYTTGVQSVPAVDMNASGQFVVVWSSEGSSSGDTASYSILGQRYASDGVAVAGEFQVNVVTTGTQYDPRVTVDASGAFVVVWESNDETDGEGFEVRARLYASDGSAVGGEIAVNSYTTSDQRRPYVAGQENGDFIVTWDSLGSGGTDSSFRSIQFQRFASDGSPLGAETQVNTFTAGFQTYPRVAFGPDEGFIVVWTSDSSDTDSSNDSVQAQLFDSAGASVGDQFQVNVYTTNAQRDPRIAVDGSGNFTVVWRGSESEADTDDRSIQARQFASDGTAIGDDFLINSYTTGRQTGPAIAMRDSGEFVVAWRSYESAAGTGQTIQGAYFQSDGTPVGDPFQVNLGSPGFAFSTDIASDGDLRFAVTWGGDEFPSTDPDGGIQASRLQLFEVAGRVGEH